MMRKPLGRGSHLCSMKYDCTTEALDIKSFEFVAAQFFLPATDPHYVGSLASRSNDQG